MPEPLDCSHAGLHSHPCCGTGQTGCVALCLAAGEVEKLCDQPRLLGALNASRGRSAKPFKNGKQVVTDMFLRARSTCNHCIMDMVRPQEALQSCVYGRWKEL